MEKDKANEHKGHLIVSDYRRPRPRETLEELQVQVRCRPKIDSLYSQNIHTFFAI